HVFCSNDENEHTMIIRYRSCSSKICQWVVNKLKKLIGQKILENDYPPIKIRSYLLDNKQRLENELNLNDILIPSLKQIRSFATSFRYKNGNNNEIEGVVQYVKSHQFKSDIEDDEIFYFGLKFYDSWSPIINPGTESSHFNLICKLRKCFGLLMKTFQIFHQFFILKIFRFFKAHQVTQEVIVLLNHITKQSALP
ncbi:unnamed protein product, partial [Brachionus calyciflorus]